MAGSKPRRWATLARGRHDAPAAPATARWPPPRALIGLLALLVAFVVGANLIAGQLRGRGYTLDVGTRADRALVQGFHGGERDAAGSSYRWTDGGAILTMRSPGINGPALLSLTLGWLPPGAEAERQLYLELDGELWATLGAPNQPRRYTLLLPPGSLLDGVFALGLNSNSQVVPPDERRIGVRVDEARLAWPGTGWALPALPVLVAQAGVALAWLAAARRLAIGGRIALAVAAALVVALALAAAIEPALAAPWQLGLLGASLLIAAIVWGAYWLLPRLLPDASATFIRGVLLITVLALAVRLLGVLYPTFISHDYLVNSGRLRNVQLGVLTLFDRPSEFSRNIAVVSPVAFLMAAPITLFGDRALALQGLYSVLDGTTPLLVAALARRLGVGERGSLLAAGLIALLPMHLTALYWGFVKQIVGQWLTLLLLLVVAGDPPRSRAGWAGAGALAAITLLIHPGGLLLAGVCLGLYVLIGGGLALRSARRPAAGPPWPQALAAPAMARWRGWFLTLAATLGVILLIQYAEAMALMVGGLIDGSTATQDSTNQMSDEGARLAQIWVGLRASFAPLPLALVAAGLGALLWRTAGPARLLAASWLASGLLFLAVDIVSGQQVRYAYFVAPLVCAGLGALLEPILGRRAGRAAAWALVALVLVAGASLWLSAALLGVKPSVNPLTH